MIREFSLPVTPEEFIIPFIASSILLIGFILMWYLFLKFRNRYDYLIGGAIAFGSFIFCTFIAFTTIVGGLYMDASLGMQFYRFSQTGATLIMMCVIPYCAVTFKLNPNIHRFINIFSFFNLVFGTIVILVTFAEPSLFLSITEQSHYAFLYERQSMWGRGEAGPLYSVRNIVNTLSLFFMLYCSCYDIFKNKLGKDKWIIALATIIFVYSAAEDLYSFDAGHYILLKNVLYSRFAVGSVLFTIIVVMHTFKYFLDGSILAKSTQVELQNNQKRNNLFMDGVKKFTNNISSISENIEETARSLQHVSEKTVDSLVITKMHSGASHQASGEFSKIASTQKNHIEEVITFTSGLFESLSDVRRNINNQKNNISDTIEYTSKLAFTMDSMDDATKNITSTSATIKNYTLERKENIVDAFKKFEDVTSITAQILASIEFIKDIAHKTNLLSINSGIQASKAGHYGRGFSVLSREIRDLASSTHHGTQEIESLLIDIANTLKGVSNIRDYVLGSFDSIIEHVNETTTAIDEIIKYMNFQSEKNEFLKLNIQMLDSSSEVIDSSIRHQNEYAIYVQKNMSLILKDFEDISNMSSHQTKDLDSIDKDITNVSKIGKDLYTYSTSILDFYSTMNIQNARMIEIVEKFNQVVKTTEDAAIDEIFEQSRPLIEIDDERLVDSQKSIEDLFLVDEDFVMDDDYVAFDDAEEAILNGVRSVDEIFILDNEIPIDKGDDIDIDKIMSSVEDEIIDSEKSIEDLFEPDEDYIEGLASSVEEPEDDYILDIDKIIEEIEEEIVYSSQSPEELFALGEEDNIAIELDKEIEIDDRFADEYLNKGIDVDKILEEIQGEQLESEKSLDELFVLDENFVAPGIVGSEEDEAYDIDKLMIEIEEEQEQLQKSPEELFALNDKNIEVALNASLEVDSQFADSYLSNDIDVDRILQEIQDEQLAAAKNPSITLEHTTTADENTDYLDSQSASEFNASSQKDYMAFIAAKYAAEHASDNEQGNVEPASAESIASELESIIDENTVGEESGDTADESQIIMNHLDFLAESYSAESDNNTSPQSISSENDDNEDIISQLDSIVADYSSENEANISEQKNGKNGNGSSIQDDTLNYLDSLSISEYEEDDDNDALDAFEAALTADDGAAQTDTDSEHFDESGIAKAEENASSDMGIDEATLSYLDSLAVSSHSIDDDIANIEIEETDEEYVAGLSADVVEEEMDDEKSQEIADMLESILVDGGDNKI